MASSIVNFSVALFAVAFLLAVAPQAAMADHKITFVNKCSESLTP